METTNPNQMDDIEYQKSLEKFSHLESRASTVNNQIKEGDWVLLQLDDSSKFVQANKKRYIYIKNIITYDTFSNVSFNKRTIQLESIIGEPWGTIFELDRGKLVKVGSAQKNNQIAPPTKETGKK